MSLRSPVRLPADGAPTSTGPLTSSPELSDEALLSGYGCSDPVAAADFVRRFERRVFGMAFTIVGDARPWRTSRRKRSPAPGATRPCSTRWRGSVATWLLTITRNLAIDAARVRRPIAIEPDVLLGLMPPAPGRDPVDVVSLHDDVARLRAALTTLPEEQRRAVVLAGIWGLSAREIAERDEIPLGTAKTRIRMALRRLRVALDDDKG